jgi:hypothetical protein
MKQRILIELNVEFDLTAAGEFDDSAQHILETELMKYAGVKKVETKILSPLNNIEKDVANDAQAEKDGKTAETERIAPETVNPNDSYCHKCNEYYFLNHICRVLR